MIVAADGVGSHLRRRHEEEFETRIEPGRNKYVWLATPRVFEAFTFGLVPTPAGWIWFHAYGQPHDEYTSSSNAHRRRGRTGFDTLSADQSLQQLERLFRDHLDGHRLLSHAGGRGSLPWLNFAPQPDRAWAAPGTLLLGDAAHPFLDRIGNAPRNAGCHRARRQPAPASGHPGGARGL